MNYLIFEQHRGDQSFDPLVFDLTSLIIPLSYTMRKFSSLILLCWVLVLGTSNDTVVVIDPASQLSLFGTSNINKFQCDCTDQFPRSTLKFNKGKSGTSATFANAMLKIRSAALDCGNKFMNKDMFKTLHGDEYPEIRIELLQVKQLNETKSGEWSNQIVEAALTIAGSRKIIDLNVRALQNEEDHFRFISDKNILMTDFGLIPPKALMGTIKVNDLIRIHMDMIVDVEQGM
jgi:hypothetical protein